MGDTPDVLKPPKAHIRKRYVKGPSEPADFIEKQKDKKPKQEHPEEVKKEEEKEEEGHEEEQDEDSGPGDLTLQDIPEGDPIGKETITITGRNYELNFDLASRKRRAEIFSGKSSKKLTGPEEEVMTAIGITGATKTELMPYLADFFNSLPKCHSSAQMMTNSRCEIAYYIMWSVLLKARQSTQKQLDEEHKAGISDLETQQIAASVDALASLKGNPINNQDHREHMQIIDIVSRIESNLKEVKTAVDNLPKHGGAKRFFRRGIP